MARVVGSHHRPVGAFNPAWCLRPQTGCSDTVMRWEDGGPLTSFSASPFSLSPFRTKRNQAPHGTGGGGAEPLSPRVSCTGQVKRDKAAGGGRGSSPLVMARLLKLRRIFSGRNTLLPGVAAVAAAAPPRAPRTKAGAGCRGAPPAICVAELDPPLPVVKRVEGEACQVSLWRRRWGEEMALEGLEFQMQGQLPPLCVYHAAAA